MTHITPRFTRCHSHPFCYFPVFFTMKTLMQGKPLSAAVEKYRVEIWDSCKALWSVWVPAQLVNFAFVPRHMRIPFGACCIDSVFWCTLTHVLSQWRACRLRGA